MTDDRHATRGRVFQDGHRSAGLLLHVTSLPSRYGIGDFGPVARRWIDCLAAAGQSWWQTLPLGMTGDGNSPYQSISSFATNVALVSPDDLVQDGWLTPDDIPASCNFPTAAVDYEAVTPFKYGLLEKAWQNFCSGRRSDLRPDLEQYIGQQSHWLNDYALFRALRVKFGTECYLQWPQELVRREPRALARERGLLRDLIDRFQFEQFVLHQQGKHLREYAHSRGIRLIGDLPFFISPDSSDIWAHPDLFLIDANFHPEYVGGVPPDYFSPDGQLWGNPVYDWEALRKTGYHWWTERLRALLQHFDLIRLDHFRAFVAAWHIPVGATTAKTGEWLPGPGADFFIAVEQALGALPFIAEDLGLITDDVLELRDEFALPGMRVLQFAFDGDPRNLFLPQNFVPNTVVYTGTHDNDTTRGWYNSLPPQIQQSVWRMLDRSPVPGDRVAEEFIRQAWESRAALAIAPLQDVLNLGTEARMNVPGLAAGNWEWRAPESLLPEPLQDYLRALTEATHRAPPS